MSDDKKVARKSESKKEKRDRKKEKKDKKDKKENDEKTAEVESSEAESVEPELEEISIDLKADVPLSKKQQRLLKKGKLDLEKLAKKNPAPKTVEEEKAAEENKPKKGEHGIWVGNLSFDTTKEDLVRFIVGKTKDYSKEDDSEFVKIEEDDITRVNIPKKEKKIKGFAYIDFNNEVQVKTAISLSELVLNGRKLLIKNASSFEGRPEKDTSKGDGNSMISISKNPPSRILFVGNLSFDTTEDNLEEHFRHCGEIVKIRMATFEDSGKCKGFAFVDFKDENGPTTALKSKLARKLINRPLRMEYGEDRSKRNPNRRVGAPGATGSGNSGFDEGFVGTSRERSSNDNEKTHSNANFNRSRDENYSKPASAPKRPRPSYNDNNNGSNKRLKSSVALATAQRASAAIVPSQGKKISFE